MARVDIKTNLIAPNEINIPLVRADHAQTANVFRTCFEVALSLFSTILGYTLGMSAPLNIHWIFVAVCGLATLAFLLLSYRYSKNSLVQGK